MSSTPRPPDRTDVHDSLVVDGLSITVGHGANTAVTDVSFTVARGEAVGLVGESGSGKTLTCRAALGILPPGCDASSGRLVLDGTDVSGFRRKDWQKLRGRHVGAVFQDPGSYLNPSIPVGRQVREAVRATSNRSRKDAAQHVRTLFVAVGLRDPEHVYHQLPAELSGGMLQRVMIAIAICADPRLLVADEATTALDVTVQAEIIELLRRLRDERDVSIVFVSHDLAVIGELCDRIVVFYAGEVVEIGTTEQILHHPRHPYTQAMMRVASVGDYERRELDVIPGAPPLVGAAITGCRFAARCEFARPSCSDGPVALTSTDGAQVRCVRADDPEVANHAERVLVKSA
jgi:peptide/nickel transport system ATP-binding protein